MTTSNYSSTASATTINDTSMSSTAHSSMCHASQDKSPSPTSVPTLQQTPLLSNHVTLADAAPSVDADSVKDDKKRLMHNHFEKKRREHIKKGFVRLHQRLPKPKAQIRLSKLDILKTAVNYIHVLHQSTQALENEVAYMDREYARSRSNAGGPFSFDAAFMSRESGSSNWIPREAVPFSYTSPHAVSHTISPWPSSPLSDTTYKLQRAETDMPLALAATRSSTHACSTCPQTGRCHRCTYHS
jgi:hypothetical protein